jgi:hypothetical protein
MICPLLRRSHPPRCRAVMGGIEPVPKDVIAAYCHGPFGACPAYRYVRASGRLLHPSDFRAWVVMGISPGRLDAPAPEVPTDPDAA